MDYSRLGHWPQKIGEDVSITRAKRNLSISMHVYTIPLYNELHYTHNTTLTMESE